MNPLSYVFLSWTLRPVVHLMAWCLLVEGQEEASA